MPPASPFCFSNFSDTVLLFAQASPDHVPPILLPCVAEMTAHITTPSYLLRWGLPNFLLGWPFKLPFGHLEYSSQQESNDLCPYEPTCTQYVKTFISVRKHLPLLPSNIIKHRMLNFMYLGESYYFNDLLATKTQQK
jgi:hypothetical protein